MKETENKTRASHTCPRPGVRSELQGRMPRPTSDTGLEWSTQEPQQETLWESNVQTSLATTELTHRGCRDVINVFN